VLVSWLGGYTPMMQLLTAIAVAGTVAMVMFALIARPLRLHVPEEKDSVPTAS
jgi:hypothetical protein